jgi:Leucine-rich repeat (LRR) protein
MRFGRFSSEILPDSFLRVLDCAFACLFISLQSLKIKAMSYNRIEFSKPSGILFCLILCMAMISACSTGRRLERAIASPETVTKLNLSRSGLTEIPAEVKQLKNLEELILFKNRIDSLPPWIGSFNNLKKLVISSNRLRALPPEIGQLQNLEYLSVKFNEIDSIPPEIGSLINLSYLDLQYNNLEKLPPEIGDLKNLEFIYLNQNQLYTIPPEIGKLENLKHLHIGRNFLSFLPYEIGQLSSLTELDIAGSGPLLDVPESIANLRTLDIIYIDQTTVLPYSIHMLRHRTRIVMRY